ncbi:hypothetical protein IMSAG025_02402 [Muribaculaceae bacterium]|nr:hypothetical protein IMSAG025_02402 [Muribaculaceae bacterium]
MVLVRGVDASISFCEAFSILEENPSACASPIFVTITVSGRMQAARRSISPFFDIPASMIARDVSLSISHIDSGTPIWELKLLGLRDMSDNGSIS